MNDLDMLYDYYTNVNLASGGYATLANRAKDDKLEQFFRDLTNQAFMVSSETAKMIIKYGGQIF